MTSCPKRRTDREAPSVATGPRRRGLGPTTMAAPSAATATMLSARSAGWAIPAAQYPARSSDAQLIIAAAMDGTFRTRRGTWATAAA